MPKVLVVDDHAIVRKGLKIILKEIGINKEVDESSKGAEALKLFSSKKYDLVLLDLNMPDTDTNMLISEFLKKDSDVKILVISMNNEDVFAVNLLAKGVKGFVSKNNTDETIKEAILKVLDNKKYLSENVLDKLIENTKAPQPSGNVFEELSERELEITKLICSGLGTKEISNTLNLKANTISTVKTRIFEKLQIKTSLDLAELAKLNGIV
jgi:DNA-binding NarL/FixJ family response regulator